MTFSIYQYLNVLLISLELISYLNACNSYNIVMFQHFIDNQLLNAVIKILKLLFILN
jgi:hypothetical protein